MASFENSARSDGLVLRHWQRKKAPRVTPDATETVKEMQSAQPEEAYAFAKYNVKSQLPDHYTDEQYEKFLKSDIWSREETDYLMKTVTEYDLRWIVIADRYDWSPLKTSPSQAEKSGNTTDVGVPMKKEEEESSSPAAAPRRRTMEDLKARYYFVAATLLALAHPPAEMSAAEFDIHEKMMQYNPDYERKRKELAEAQLNRSKEEVNEETLLLEELKRIVMNERQFVEDRKELYARLEAPPVNPNIPIYNTSQGLNTLLANLVAADKSKKRRSLFVQESLASPVSPMVPSQAPSVRDSKPPETPSTAAPHAAPTTTEVKHGKKNASVSGPPPQPQIKQLSPAEEAKYGVSHHERLTSGVHFRNDKAVKMTQAKSNIQTQKLAAALTELEIPPRLVMPTERVVKEFEKLIQQVNILLDARKIADKVESEIKVLEAAKAERERKEKEAAEGGFGEGGLGAQEKGGEQGEGTTVDGSGQRSTVAPSASPVGRAGGGNKRSASVMSSSSEKMAHKRPKKQ
ncbi:swr complex subunit [Ascosphaera aggregata]|nr:swr complex subunit [Ascosphaera aggregata]